MNILIWLAIGVSLYLLCGVATAWWLIPMYRRLNKQIAAGQTDLPEDVQVMVSTLVRVPIKTMVNYILGAWPLCIGIYCSAWLKRLFRSLGLVDHSDHRQQEPTGGQLMRLPNGELVEVYHAPGDALPKVLVDSDVHQDIARIDIVLSEANLDFITVNILRNYRMLLISQQIHYEAPPPELIPPGDFCYANSNGTWMWQEADIVRSYWGVIYRGWLHKSALPLFVEAPPPRNQSTSTN